MASSDSNTTHNSDACIYPSVFYEPLETTAPYIVNSALNIASGIVATFANILVFLAIRRSTSIRLPSRVLLCSLVLTDIGVGLVVQPIFATFLIMKIRKSHSICTLLMAYSFPGSLFSSVSMLNMTVISLDRYKALFSFDKYQQIVTVRRVTVVLAFIWLFSAFLALTTLWIEMLEAWVLLSTLVAVVSFSVMSVVYISIYRGLRHAGHGNQVQPGDGQVPTQQQAGNTPNMARYRRIASTMMWMYFLIIICYLPSILVLFPLPLFEYNSLINCIIEYTYTLVLINSCLNPIVFCIRMPDIRAEVVRQLKKFTCHNT